MPFADAQALTLVRDALWKRPRRGACVMVGAGLSRNQGPPHAGAAPPPTWSKLAQLLSKRINVPSARGAPTKPRPSAHSCPVLAQQFEARFGRAALDNFLLDHIPDDRTPHAIHTNLLKLPWSEVFTTNWDTLLERAAQKIPYVAYRQVLTGSDLSASHIPRIVKLHGSFPSHRPFIITEEDYRKYPQSHAPLVNTVRQALMERVVLLLGFSGDDPNFLHWLGWVRDHLGRSAPRLFLGGFLKLTHPRRRLLEERGVVPIDLANYPKASDKSPHSHRRAIEWILKKLARSDPYSQNWPTPKKARKQIVSTSTPVPAVPSTGTHDEPVTLPQESDTAKRQKSVVSVIRSWRRDRARYPEWVVLPSTKAGKIEGETDAMMEAIIQCTDTWPPVKRLKALYELSWRHNILMNPYSPDLTTAIENTITTIDKEVLPGYAGSVSKRDAIVEHRGDLLLSLLTEARFGFQLARVSEITDLWKSNRPTSTEAQNRFRHEEGLWLLTVQDFDLLSDRMKSWDVQNHDPIWTLRKAALLADSGQYATAIDLVQRVLPEIEMEATRNTNIRNLSRLSWATQWRKGIKTEEWWNSEFSGQPNYPKIFDKWSQIAKYDCDAYTDLKQIEGAVEPVRSQAPEGLLFQRPHHVHELRFDEYRRYQHTRRAIRTLELGGLPCHFPSVAIAAGVLEKSAVAMSDLGVQHSLPIAIRAGGSNPDKMLSTILTSGHVARMDSDTAEQVIQSLEQGRDHHTNQRPGTYREGAVRTRRVSANVAALARCVPRAKSDKAEELFRWALAYGTRKNKNRDYSLWRSVRLLWQRSWTTINPQRRQEMLVEVLASPALEHIPLWQYDDPAEVAFNADITIDPKGGDDRAWEKCAHSVADALRLGEDARRRAARRLLGMVIHGAVPDKERVELGRALWRGTAFDGKAMPGEITLSDWTVRALPEPEKGVADRCFRRKWVQRTLMDNEDTILEAILAEVCNAWRTDIPWYRAITLSSEEQNWLWDTVHQWLTTPLRLRLSMIPRNDEQWHLINGLAAIVSRREVPPHVLTGLYDKIEELKHPTRTVMSDLFNGNEYRLVAAAAGLEAEGSCRADRAEMLVRMGILSDDKRVQNSALDGLCWWLGEIEKPGVGIRAPSLSCVLDIGMALASQREGGMEGAVSGVIAVLSGSSEEYRNAVVPLAKEGLHRWWPVLQYGRADVGGTDWDKTVVQRRVWCVRLARAMERSGHGDSDKVKKWLEAAENDPMASVRYAAEE